MQPISKIYNSLSDFFQQEDEHFVSSQPISIEQIAKAMKFMDENNVSNKKMLKNVVSHAGAKLGKLNDLSREQGIQLLTIYYTAMQNPVLANLLDREDQGGDPGDQKLTLNDIKYAVSLLENKFAGG